MGNAFRVVTHARWVLGGHVGPEELALVGRAGQLADLIQEVAETCWAGAENVHRHADTLTERVYLLW